jgi:hypothetical protein
MTPGVLSRDSPGLYDSIIKNQQQIRAARNRLLGFSTGCILAGGVAIALLKRNSSLSGEPPDGALDGV